MHVLVRAVNMGIDHVSSSYIASFVLILFARITSQHLKLWPNNRNIAGCNMLHVFCHPVVPCYMLDLAGSNLKIVKFFRQHLTIEIDSMLLCICSVIDHR